MVWMDSTQSHWSWLVGTGADTAQHLRCDTDSECKCGLVGTCLYLGSLRKSLSSGSDTESSHSISAKESLRKLAHLALGTAPCLGPADKRCGYTEVLN